MADDGLHADGASRPSFFLSYAHEDRQYVERLAAHLRKADVSAWFDADITWGDRWTQRLAEQIRQAAGLIVVMSPAAARSEWVEREILEGQHHDRPFRPILLSGERLFLLAATQFFDARQGQLPGDRELRELRKILARPPAAAGAAPLLDWGKFAHGGDTAAQDQDTNALLVKLHGLLEDKRFEHADIITTSMLLNAAGRAEEGWLREDDGLLLVPGMFASIDLLWQQSSGGRYGFQAQLSRHPKPPPGVMPGRGQDFTALARAVGWTGQRRAATPRYAGFVGSAAGDRQEGFFPTLRNPQLESRQGWYDRWVKTVMAVQLALRRWADSS